MPVKISGKGQKAWEKHLGSRKKIKAPSSAIEPCAYRCGRPMQGIIIWVSDGPVHTHRPAHLECRDEWHRENCSGDCDVWMCPVKEKAHE
jgi:hypothetical protein